MLLAVLLLAGCDGGTTDVTGKLCGTPGAQMTTLDNGMMWCEGQ